VSDFHEGQARTPSIFGKSYNSAGGPLCDERKGREKKGVCSVAQALLWERRAWRLKALCAFTSHFLNDEDGSYLDSFNRAGRGR